MVIRLQMTEVLIDTGVNSILLHNAIATMLCISSNSLELLQGVLPVALSILLFPF